MEEVEGGRLVGVVSGVVGTLEVDPGKRVDVTRTGEGPAATMLILATERKKWNHSDLNRVFLGRMLNV